VRVRPPSLYVFHFLWWLRDPRDNLSQRCTGTAHGDQIESGGAQPINIFWFPNPPAPSRVESDRNVFGVLVLALCRPRVITLHFSVHRVNADARTHCPSCVESAPRRIAACATQINSPAVERAKSVLVLRRAVSPRIGPLLAYPAQKLAFRHQVSRSRFFNSRSSCSVEAA